MTIYKQKRPGKPRKVFIISGKSGTDYFSSLLKLAKAYPNITYRQLRYALQTSNEAQIGDYKLISAIVR
jgi:hypothetical protein